MPRWLAIRFVFGWSRSKAGLRAGAKPNAASKSQPLSAKNWLRPYENEGRCRARFGMPARFAPETDYGRFDRERRIRRGSGQLAEPVEAVQRVASGEIGRASCRERG